MYATTKIMIVYPQIKPVFRRPRLVLSPESVKYYEIQCQPLFKGHDPRVQHTKGRKMIATISSSFSVIVMFKLPSRGWREQVAGQV